MNNIIWIITLLIGLFFVGFYFVQVYKKRCQYNTSLVITSFLYGAGTVTGILLILSLIFKELWDAIPDRNTYITIGGLAIIAVSISEMLKNTGILGEKKKGISSE